MWMIHEWKLNGVTRNFGDAIYELFLDPVTLREWEADREKLHYPVGSVIANEHLEAAVKANLTPVFHGCGWRGRELEPELVKLAEFDGVRGPHTRQELLRHGIDEPVVGDPAYDIADLYAPGPPNGLAIVIRHITDRTEKTPDSIHELGADVIFSPVVDDEADMVEFIQKLSGARFILTGSMHAAILADAYHIPFALFGGERVDCPPKWADWLASIGVEQLDFVDNIKEGREWYNSVVAPTKKET